MSDYIFKAVDKRTYNIVTVHAMDDYFGSHEYGYFIRGEKEIYNASEFEEKYKRVQEDLYEESI